MGPAKYWGRLFGFIVELYAAPSQGRLPWHRTRSFRRCVYCRIPARCEYPRPEPPEDCSHEPTTLVSISSPHTRYLADSLSEATGWWAGLLEMALSNMVYESTKLWKGCIDRLMTHRLVAAQVC